MANRPILVGLGALLAAALGAPAPGQEPGLSVLLEQLDDSSREGQDQKAVATLQVLKNRYPLLESETDRKEVVGAIDKCLSRRRKEGDDHLYLAAVRAFAALGAHGEEAACRALRRSSVRKRPAVLSATILALGSFAEPKRIRLLTDYLDHRDPTVVATAVKALGFYQNEKEEYRKRIVEDLVTVYATLASNARTPGHGAKHARVRGPMDASLRQLTGQKVGGAVAWQRWYNKNKNKRWSELKG